MPLLLQLTLRVLETTDGCLKTLTLEQLQLTVSLYDTFPSTGVISLERNLKSLIARYFRCTMRHRLTLESTLTTLPLIQRNQTDSRHLINHHIWDSQELVALTHHQVIHRHHRPAILNLQVPRTPLCLQMDSEAVLNRGHRHRQVSVACDVALTVSFIPNF